MILRFAEQARVALGLTDGEAAFIVVAGIWSFDSLHAILAADATIGGPGSPYAVRRDLLLGRLMPLLSADYRAVLAGPPPPPSPGGAAPTAGPEDRTAPGLPRIDLSGEEPVGLVDFAPGVLDRWPLRDQDGTPTCVAFATTACLEWQIGMRDGTFAPAGPARAVTQLSAGFLYQAMRALPDLTRFPDWTEGATKLEFAAKVLATAGICTVDVWPDFPPAGATPGDEVLAAAAQMKVKQGAFEDIPPTAAVRQPGVAPFVLSLLRQRRPVAIAMPEFVPPQAQPGARTNWWLDDVVVHGVLGMPLAGWQRSVGHAVCAVGFHPDAGNPNGGGGWFIFRNSMGLRWARSAPNAAGPPLPGRGYGAIPAQYIEDHCWEIFSPDIG